uniref:hypothetical protein n=1 Tax=Parolsenella massiliensis TaxID=1871022 RepID=UPI0009332623|nr:hypothetical protein [Parolsenella massiliensis]
MRPSVREQAETREKDEALRETGVETREASGVERLGGALARVGLALSACMLGVVLLVVCFSTVWLMVGADDGNLTQSMSLRTWLGASTRVDLALGVAGALVVVALCRLAWNRGRVLDGRAATRALVVGTFVFQLVVILALQARDTYWGDSWMVSDFVDKAMSGGVESLFRGPYHTLFYDARLYFSCYPFQATFFWLLYGLRLVFGEFSFMAFQVLSALSTSLGTWALLSLTESLTPSAGARRVAWVLVALCLPMYWLSTFLYGNALGCGLALAFLAMQARAMGCGGRAAAAWCAGSLVPLTAALCVKATFVLFAIGAVLAWLVLALMRRRAWGLVGCVAVVACAHALSGLPFAALRAASGGYEFGEPLTTLNHIELGLRMGAGEFYVSVDGGVYEYAPGGWSNHANAVWQASGENADVQNAIAVHELASDVLDFATRPAYAARFFAVKLATEWADPTYQSLYYLSMCGNASGVRANPADESTLLGAACARLTNLLDGYQTVTFASAFGLVAVACRRWGRRGEPAAEGDAPAGEGSRATLLLLAAVFFTGFGCYLLWEAKAVYVLPFAIAIVPLASAGLSAALRYTNRLFPHRREAHKPSTARGRE